MYSFRNKDNFYDEGLLVPRPTRRLVDHPLSAVRDFLFNIFAPTLHVGGRSSILNLRTRHAVVVGTFLSQVWSGLVRKISLPRTFHPVANHYTGWATRATVLILASAKWGFSSVLVVTYCNVFKLRGIFSQLPLVIKIQIKSNYSGKCSLFSPVKCSHPQLLHSRYSATLT